MPVWQECFWRACSTAGRRTRFVWRSEPLGDILRQALAEALVLTLIGGAGAVVLAGWLAGVSSDTLSLGGPIGVVGLDYGVRLDGRVLGCALAAAFVTALAA
ncbi:MAG: hypothetical protein ABIG68_09930 [Acidobacteriota bacterium]